MSEPEKFRCSICGKLCFGFGHNPQPVLEDFDARCCGDCNDTVVIPTRIQLIQKDKLS